MKRFVSFLFSFMLLFGVLTPGVSAESADAYPVEKYFPIDFEDHWANDILADFVQADVLNGYDTQDGVVLKPGDPVTRAEFVAILMRSTATPEQTDGKAFADVNSKDWFYAPVMTASAQSIVYGIQEGVFAPNRNITRAEIAAILVRFFEGKLAFDASVKTFTDVSDHWAKAEIERLSQAEIVDGYGSDFRPNRHATRAEAAAMIHRALQKEIQDAPEDTLLIEAVKQYDQLQLDAMVKKEYEQATTAILGGSIGFYRAMDLYGMEIINEMHDNGVQIDIVSEGEGDYYQVTRKSARYAQVERSGMTVEITVSHEGETETFTENMDEVIHLRLTEQGWKLYGSDAYSKFWE